MSAASRPTSKDVARAAGVSQAAVSLVLGGKWPGRVSAATAERVREAARSLGYRPNLAARDLRTGRTRTALLVVPALTNEFFARVHAGAASAAAAHGFGVLLYPSPEGTGPATDPFASAPAALDGVLASSMAAQALSGIGAGALPLVMLDSDPATGPGTATVNLAIADGMRQAAGHLLELGHRDLVHLAADVDSWTFEIRAAALAASVAGVPGARLRTHRCALGVAEAQAAVTALLTAPGERPTALVCDDDLLAAGACKAARRLGVRVPGELSVTGFDDLTLATAVEPELTTVTLPAEEFGARGMAALLTAVDGGTPADEELPVTLTVRGSTGPAPART
ncbi:MULTISPECIES: LacI family DNA-binding transcriptional regulator [Streptomyces]|uniref:LacI family transcriptional regulator n=1 Tax=Streptomyces odorifer TaxID=53450 RepID=A0A7Y6F4A2_9ACTN|nr:MULTISPECIES: LacI family DNA-binding transcriptional regulator [Streptomyces]MCR0987150.1 LacI family transcriptional regulator [Streptomyces albidoflavus]NUV31625.1 LacI family transcriptional regulator [Streptomyces odorifer]NUV33397.1 LacI family transcriptional regulator [Streptomyces sp. KAI-27]NUV47263.1 LacI family transcriptional regulator [Streptomyces sp. CAI-78]